MPGTSKTLRSRLVSLAVLSFAVFAVEPVAGQPPQGRGLVASLDAADLATLVARCGGVEPQEDSLVVVREHACSRRRSGPCEILAFEENKQCPA